MRRLVLLAAVIALALAGCATAGPTAGPTQPSLSSPSLSSPPLNPPPVEITRSGGFAGVHETLTVDGDGQWQSDSGSGQLSVAALNRLAAILADPALPTEVGSAMPGRCCDMFQYQLRVGDRTYQFGEPDIGPLLTELLGLLRRETGF